MYRKVEHVVFEGLQFQALRKLCKSGIARLHLPYVVEREFQTYQAQVCRRSAPSEALGEELAAEFFGTESSF